MMQRYYKLLPSLFYSAWLRLRLPYQRTRLGRGWLSISTLLSLLVLGIVYSQLTGITNWRSYANYLSLGLLSWNLLANNISSSCDLVNRVKAQLLNQELPPGYYVLEQWLTHLFVFLQGSLGIALLLIATDQSFLPNLIAGGWLGLLNLSIGCLWISIIITSISVYIPDFVPLVPVGLQLAFLSSPILYYSKSLGKLAWISNVNPLYPFITLARQAWVSNMNWGLQSLILVLQIILVAVLLPWLDRQRWGLIERL